METIHRKAAGSIPVERIIIISLTAHGLDGLWHPTVMENNSSEGGWFDFSWAEKYDIFFDFFGHFRFFFVLYIAFLVALLRSIQHGDVYVLHPPHIPHEKSPKKH